jgi:hypothetical protein
MVAELLDPRRLSRVRISCSLVHQLHKTSSLLWSRGCSYQREESELSSDDKDECSFQRSIDYTYCGKFKRSTNCTYCGKFKHSTNYTHCGKFKRSANCTNCSKLKRSTNCTYCGKFKRCPSNCSKYQRSPAYRGQCERSSAEWDGRGECSETDCNDCQRTKAERNRREPPLACGFWNDH